MRTKNTCGGARPGAGRPKIDPQLLKIPVSYRLPKWMVENLRSSKTSQSTLIEAALIEFYGWRPPAE